MDRGSTSSPDISLPSRLSPLAFSFPRSGLQLPFRHSNTRIKPFRKKLLIAPRSSPRNFPLMRHFLRPCVPFFACLYILEFFRPIYSRPNNLDARGEVRCRSCGQDAHKAHQHLARGTSDVGAPVNMREVGGYTYTYIYVCIRRPRA